MTHSDVAISRDEFERLIEAFVTPKAAVAVAVSGGGDSMALVRLADVWAKQHDVHVTEGA